MAGDGVSHPQKGQTVVIHYTGYVSTPTNLMRLMRFHVLQLEDGRRFDSSKDRAKPLRFKLGEEQVIPGLEEGVERLCLNEKAKVYIPAYKAYGQKGFPGLIPPDSNLIYELELLAFR